MDILDCKPDEMSSFQPPSSVDESQDLIQISNKPSPVKIVDDRLSEHSETLPCLEEPFGKMEKCAEDILETETQGKDRPTPPQEFDFFLTESIIKQPNLTEDFIEAEKGGGMSIKSSSPEPGNLIDKEEVIVVPIKKEEKEAHAEEEEEEQGELSDNDEAPPPEPVPRDYPEIGAVEPKKILSACGLDTWFKPKSLHPKVEALVYWRDPKKSGIVFGSILTVLLSLTLYSLISVVAYTSLIILTAAISFRIYKSVLQAVQKTQDGHPFHSYLEPILVHPVVTAFFHNIQELLELDLTISNEKAKELAGLAVDQVNRAITELRRRFLVEDLVDSIKFGLVLWILTYVGAWFNGLTLIILAFVALFTAPKVYENNQSQIDANLDLVRARINAITEKVQAVIPIGKKSEDVTKSKDE